MNKILAIIALIGQSCVQPSHECACSGSWVWNMGAWYYDALYDDIDKMDCELHLLFEKSGVTPPVAVVNLTPDLIECGSHGPSWGCFWSEGLIDVTMLTGESVLETAWIHEFLHAALDQWYGRGKMNYGHGWECAWGHWIAQVQVGLMGYEQDDTDDACRQDGYTLYWR